MVPSAQEQIRRELEYGERLLWSGRPCPVPRFTWQSILGLLVAGGLIAGISTTALPSLLARGWDATWLFYAAFVAVCGTVILRVLFAPPVYGTTAYGLTDSYAIIVPNLKRRGIIRVPLDSSARVSLQVGRLGKDRSGRSETGNVIGTIRFESYRMGRGDDEHTPSFVRIEDAVRVHALIERIQRTAPDDGNSTRH